MKNDQMRSLIKHLAEEKAPATEINLWPALHSQLQMSPSIQSKGIIMDQKPERKPRNWKFAYALLVVVLIFGVFFALPQGRTLAQEVIHFFIRGESNVMPGPTATPVEWVEQTPGVSAPTITPQPTPTEIVFAPKCGSFSQPHCSVEEIRNLLTYPVYALPELPQDMVFSGASSDAYQVLLAYKNENQSNIMTILEKPIRDQSDIISGDVGSDAEILSMQIGAVTGEYVKGSYDGAYNPPQWNPDANVQVLRWVDHEMQFTIEFLGYRESMGADELADLAESLTDGPVGESGLPLLEMKDLSRSDDYSINIHTLYPLSLAEAEELAGFKLLTPQILPETLSFIGARFDENTKEIIYLYHYVYPEAFASMDGLVISEQLIAQGTDCSLCEFVRGTYDPLAGVHVISKDAVVEEVHIGNITGQYLEGIGWIIRDDSIGWEWDPSDYRKRLRFQQDGLAIEIWSDSDDITKENMIFIAENLQ